MSRLSTVGGIQQELAIRLNEVSADEADVYLTWINTTTFDIGNSLDNPRWLEASSYLTTSAGTRNYGLANDFSNMYSVKIPSQDIKLSYVPKEQFDALQPSATESGIPSIYTIYQEDIEFYPSPNSTLNVEYRYAKGLDTVSAASAVLPIPENYAELYINKGVAYGLERRGDYGQAAILHKRYDALLDKMNQDLKSIESKRIKSVREFRRSAPGADKLINFLG